MSRSPSPGTMGGGGGVALVCRRGWRLWWARKVEAMARAAEPGRDQDEPAAPQLALGDHEERAA